MKYLLSAFLVTLLPGVVAHQPNDGVNLSHSIDFERSLDPTLRHANGVPIGLEHFIDERGDNIPRGWLDEHGELVVPTRPLPKNEHGQNPPIFNNPDVQGPCFTPQYDVADGTTILMYQTEYNPFTEWSTYNVMNNNTTTATNDPCGFQYTGTGEIGPGHSISIQTRRPGVGSPLLPADAYALTVWTSGWVEPVYTPFGWTMCDTETIISVWVYDEAEKFFFSDGTLAGWWRFGIEWPDDPSLVGVKAYYQSVIASVTENEGRAGNVWVNIGSDNE